MIFVFNDTLGVFGGSQTLIYRMCDWLHEKKIKTVVMCNSADNTEIVSKLETIGVTIDCFPPSDYSHTNKTLSKLLQEDKQLLVVSFGFDRYMNIECVKAKYGLQFDNIIYDIIPITFFKGEGVKSKFLKKHAKKVYSKIVLRMLANNSIRTLEDTYIDGVRNFFNFRDNEFTPKILRLPMKCVKLPDYETIIKQGFDSDLILSAARADFPFKGYLVGLVDQFCEIKKSLPSVKLKIYADGGDMHILRDKVDAVPEDIRKDISLNGWITYEELYQEMKKAKVYIGMGTTVMDAALNYKPSVVVSFDTMNCLSDGLFSDNPYCTATNGDGYPEATKTLLRVLNTSFDEYRTLCIKNFDVVFENYNIDYVMNDFVNIKTQNQKCLLKPLERLEHNMNNFVNTIRFRNAEDKNRYVKNN